jgi:hypothetical protein
MADEWKIEGVGADLKALEVIRDAVHRATQVAMIAGGEVVVKAARLQFNGQHPRGTPRSVGGNRPQSISENLKNSIRIFSTVETEPGTWETRVGPTMIYARRIELGFAGVDSLGRDYKPHVDSRGRVTVGGRPYPYLKPGLNIARPAINLIVQREWEKALSIK